MVGTEIGQAVLKMDENVVKVMEDYKNGEVSALGPIQLNMQLGRTRDNTAYKMSTVPSEQSIF